MKSNLVTIEEDKTPSWTGAELVEITNNCNETIIVLTDPEKKGDDYPEKNFSGTIVGSEDELAPVGEYKKYLEKSMWKLCSGKIELLN